MAFEPPPSEEKELAYDLRQIYANELVGEHLKDVARARKSNNYYFYIKCLKDLFIITKFKWKDKQSKNSKGEDCKAIDRWNELYNAAIEISNKNQAEFTGRSHDRKKIAEIEEALNNLEEFMYEMIDTANMFGSTWEDEGL